MIIMPKVDPKENAITLRGDQKAREKSRIPTGTPGTMGRNGGTASASASASAAGRVTVKPKKLSLQEQMILDAQAAAALSSSSANGGGDGGGGGGGGDSNEAVSNALLDKNIGKSSSATNVSNIVRKPKLSVEESAVDSVFRTSTAGSIVELD
jgi:hypothetical protein